LLLQIVNYSVRSLIVIIGILILSGILLPEFDSYTRIVFGIVFVFFGIYRLIMFYSQNKRYRMEEDSDDE